ncbi:MAG TPA: nucleotidyltransferase domain-containing protein [Spirochaetota bacterium]|nr:nucleotidyltransferase domain-containing protein [Spirochaetota bacterium]HPJ34096.1 nucleotidyltransferase domain-containing protein [Spirochaetota bacterium]
MLNEQKINSIREVIVSRFSPAAIYIFGSYADGRATEQSDLDLLVIDNSSAPNDRVGIEISKALFPRDYSLDIFVLKPDEIREKLKRNSKFWNDIIKNGKKIYERQ